MAAFCLFLKKSHVNFVNLSRNRSRFLIEKTRSKPTNCHLIYPQCFSNSHWFQFGSESSISGQCGCRSGSETLPSPFPHIIFHYHKLINRRCSQNMFCIIKNFVEVFPFNHCSGFGSGSQI
jgi:hypothetical protein